MIRLLPVAVLALLPVILAALAGFSAFDLAGLDGLRGLAADSDWLAGALACLIVGTLVAAVALPLGAVAAFGAWSVGQAHAGRRSALMVLLGLPLLLPRAALAPGLAALAAHLDWPADFGAWALAELPVAAPLVALLGLLVLRLADPNLPRAAASFGAGRVRTAVLLMPLAWPGLRLGLVAAFLLPFGDVITARLLAGPTHRPLPVLIVDGVARGDPAGFAAAMLLAAVSLLLILAAWPRRLPRGREGLS